MSFTSQGLGAMRSYHRLPKYPVFCRRMGHLPKHLRFAAQCLLLLGRVDAVEMDMSPDRQDYDTVALGSKEAPW